MIMKSPSDTAASVHHFRRSSSITVCSIAPTSSTAVRLLVSPSRNDGSGRDGFVDGQPIPGGTGNRPLEEVGCPRAGSTARPRESGGVGCRDLSYVAEDGLTETSRE